MNFEELQKDLEQFIKEKKDSDLFQYFFFTHFSWMKKYNEDENFRKEVDAIGFDNFLNNARAEAVRVLEESKKLNTFYHPLPGIYENYNVFDGIRFSLQILRNMKLDDELKRIVDIFWTLSDKYENTPYAYNIKKLRQYLFQNLISPNLSLFRPKTYLEALKLMRNVIIQLERFVLDHNIEVIERGFDSVGFIYDSKEAEKILKDWNANHDIKFRHKFYNKVIRFKNYIVKISNDAEVWTELTNTADLKREKLKQKIIKKIINNEYKEALKYARQLDEYVSKRTKKHSSYVRYLVFYFPKASFHLKEEEMIDLSHLHKDKREIAKEILGLNEFKY